MVLGSVVIEGDFPCRVHLLRSLWLSKTKSEKLFSTLFQEIATLLCNTQILFEFMYSKILQFVEIKRFYRISDLILLNLR